MWAVRHYVPLDLSEISNYVLTCTYDLIYKYLWYLSILMYLVSFTESEELRVFLCQPNLHESCFCINLELQKCTVMRCPLEIIGARLRLQASKTDSNTSSQHFQ